MFLEVVVLITILLFCIYIFINVLLSSKSANRLQRQSFASIVFWIMIWVLTILITELSIKNLPLALWMSRLSFVTSLLVVFSFFIFVSKYRKTGGFKLDIPIFSIMTFVLSGLSMTDLLVKEVSVVNGMIKSTNGPLPIYYGIFIAVLFLYSSFVFYRIYRKEKNLVIKTQMLYILVGSGLSIFSSFLTNLVFPMIGFGEIRFLGPLGLIFFMVGTYYSILRYRFISNKVVVSRFVNTLILALLTYGMFYLVYFIQVSIWKEIFSAGALLSGFLFAFIFIYLFSTVRESIRKILEKFFYKSVVPPQKEFDLFVKKLNTLLDVNKILMETKSLLERVFGTECTLLVVIDNKYQQDFSYLSDYQIDSEDLDIITSVDSAVLKDELFYEEKDYTKLFEILQKYKIQYVMPALLLSNINWKIFILLGDKKSRESYSIQDIEFVESVDSLLSVSLQRAYLYQEVLAFNKTLEVKVQEQTKELQLRVVELEEARRKERDMIDIMGHELRTPATIAKLNIDMMKKYIDRNPKEFKKYLDRVKNSIESEIRLINALLTSAKLEGEKVEIKRERVAISEVIEHVVHTYTYEAESKDLKVIVDLDEDTPDVFVDKVRVTEIMDNLLNNAIKYTEEGSIIIQTVHTKDHVQVNVVDSGVGIPDEEIPKLGTKFHRVSNYIKGSDEFKIVRPGGTGLGLYVVFALIEQMGGKIWVKSDLGKGTTFSFTLPVYTGQKEDIVDSKTKDMYKKFGFKKT